MNCLSPYPRLALLWLCGCISPLLAESTVIAPAALVEAEPTNEDDLAAQSVVVFNTAVPESQKLALYYAEKRGIPLAQVLGFNANAAEEISREEFDSTIRGPLLEAFNERGWWTMSETSSSSKPIVKDSQIRVLTLMLGMPSKVKRKKDNPAVCQQDEASVDSELCLLGRAGSGNDGPLENPYFARKTRFAKGHDYPGLLLVGRLDGPSPDIVRRMIDDAIAVEQTGLVGRGVIDLALKSGAYEEGEEWLRKTAASYRHNGIPFFVDRYAPLAPDHWPLPDTALYFGWYSGGITGAVASSGFQFKRGAVACHLHSFSANTLRSTTDAWVGPLLAHGAAATMGNVYEPYLSFTIHFDILNERLLSGYTLAEASWNATPGLSWMNVVLGDPLYRPFANRSMGSDEDRDYALYKALVEKHSNDSDSRELKQDLLTLADSRSNPRLLEFLALLAAYEGKVSEGAEMLEHARSLYSKPADQLRTVIYEVELLHRETSPSKDRQAKSLTTAALANAAFAGIEALEALRPFAPTAPPPPASTSLK